MTGVNIFTRFETVYQDEKSAIRALDEVSRQFAETVAIRYYGPHGKIYSILAIYKSTRPGDYEIYYNSSEATDISVYRTVKENGKTDIECIESFISGKILKTGDIVELIDPEDGGYTTYIWTGSNGWEKIGQNRINKIYGGSF